MDKVVKNLLKIGGNSAKRFFSPISSPIFMVGSSEVKVSPLKIREGIKGAKFRFNGGNNSGNCVHSYPQSLDVVENGQYSTRVLIAGIPSYFLDGMNSETTSFVTASLTSM